MSKSATSRLAEEKASLKRRKLVRRSRLRKAFAWVLASALTTQSLFAQNAQNAGSPSSGGLVNQMGASLQRLEQNGPGLFYYGVNGADRGLGYQGSYMTVGGFIPYAEDDMGGFWSADLRGHLSNYGGFFSNVGVVRQQFLGGALGTFGLYWDYDGDLNQYPTSIAGGNSFGHAYSQIGLSGALLTDFGNLRSNGYMPTGTTGFTQGSPGSPFYQNVIMAQYGLDAALTGVDLEVGAYIPGLADWAGMWSVGGYAFGNIKDKYSNGTPVVPNFGGVYSRIDVTLANNWDFQIQANNDSFFDWTGYARLTYRVGGSRRRSVADQIEQPPQRNEHIVRAHNTPIVAINPATGTPWRVIHVNNTSNSLGTAESPYPTLAQGNAAATNPWDIVFVDQGDGTATGYNTAFSFQAANQYLVGNGAAFYVPTANAGLINIATNLDGTKPLLTNPSGASVIIGSAGAGAVVSNFQITGSNIGIQGTGLLSSGIARTGPVPFASITGNSVINNVLISALPNVAGQTGVQLTGATGNINFVDTGISNMTAGGFVVNGGAANVNYSGAILNDSTTSGISSDLISISNTTGGTINLATTQTGSLINNISDNGGDGILINTSQAAIQMDNVTLANTNKTSLRVLNSTNTINLGSATTANSSITGGLNGSILVQGGDPTLQYFGTIDNTAGYLLNVNGTTSGSVNLPIGPHNNSANGLGILVTNAAGNVNVVNANITSLENGISINNSSGNQIFDDITISDAGGAAFAGVSLLNNTGESIFSNLNITTTGGATGFQASNDNIVAVTGTSSVNSTGGPAISMNNVADADINFINVTSTTSSGNGVLLDGVAGVFAASNLNSTGSLGSGLVIRNSSAIDVDVQSATMSTGGLAVANGIEVINSSSSVSGLINFGNINITTANGAGLVVSASNDVVVGGGTIAAIGGAAVDSTTSAIDITLARMSSNTSNGNGLNLVGNSGAITSTQTTILGSAGVGINIVDNVPGFVADLGATAVTNSVGIGINVQNTISPVPATLTNFGSLAVTTTNATGMQSINGGTINFNSPATITASGGAAIILKDTIGTTNSVLGSGFTFASLGSTNSTGNGILLENLNSDLTVTGSTTITGASGESVKIIDNQSPAGTYDIRLNTVNISARSNVGLSVDGIGGQVEVQSLIIGNTLLAAGPAASFTNTSTQGGRVYISGGTISNSNGNGISIRDAIVALGPIQISSPNSNCILATAEAGETTTFSYTGGINTGAGNDGIRIEANGGIVNATLAQNSIDVNAVPIEAIVWNAAGEINLDAQSNFGALGGAPTTGPITLNNSAGGVLSISQSSTANLGTSNSGAVVTSVGVVTFNAIVPTPPPPSP